MIPRKSVGVSVGRGRSLLAAGLILSGLLWSSATRAETITDPLDNWNMVEAHSPGLILDSTNPNFFYQDVARAKNNDGTNVGSFYYHYDNISSFAAFVYFWDSVGRLEIYSSPDNVTWTPVSYSHSDVVSTTGGGADGWAAAKVFADLPPGTNYLAFTLRGGDASHVWTPQVGQVSLEVSKSSTAVPGPSGLSVMAAGGQASLTWYPMDGADSYTIKRRSASSKEFHTMATGVTSTSYIDDGLTNGAKYYYAVTAETKTGATGESEEVLAVPASGVVVMADPTTDWSLTSAHTANLDFTKMLGNVPCITRSGMASESIDYNVPSASGFSLNVYSADADATNAVLVQSSNDGVNWSTVPTSLKLTVKAAPNVYASVCTPAAKLPSGTNYLRFTLPSDGTTESKTSIGQVRITYGAMSPVKTAAARSTKHSAQ